MFHSFTLPNLQDALAVAPEIVLWIFACLAFLIEWFRPRRIMPGDQVYELFSAEFAAVLGLLLSFVMVLVEANNGATYPAFSGNVVMDHLAWFYKGACILTSLILIPSSWQYMQNRPNRQEFYGLLLLATSGMTLMVESNDLIMLFLSIEFLSITSFVLVGYLKGNRRSTEGAVKYFLFGAICSSLMLYGMSLIYGLTGSTNFQVIAGLLPHNEEVVPSAIVVFMVVTFFAGIGFKISMWPFHMWAPDAYEGAPTPVTAFLSVGPKLAGIAVFVRVVQTMFQFETDWPVVLGIVALITMTWGNLAALGQNNIKRMLAYSSIAQAGYLLVGVVSLAVLSQSNGSVTNLRLFSAAQQYALPAVLVYSLAYLVMNLGAFIVVIDVERQTRTSDLQGFAGLGDRNPLLAAAMTIFLLGLGGIPLTVGFIGKLYLFGAAVAGGASGANPILWILAGFGVANSVISIYYYFRVVAPIWMQPGEPGDWAPAMVNVGVEWLAAALAFITVALGIFGQGLIGPASQFDGVYSPGAAQSGTAPTGYPNTGYPGSGYPNSGYPRSGYPRSGYPRSGYPANGYPASARRGAPSATHRH